MGLRGFSQLSCRESGLKAVKIRGPGALGVLRVNGEPSVKDKTDNTIRRETLLFWYLHKNTVCGLMQEAMNKKIYLAWG